MYESVLYLYTNARPYIYKLCSRAQKGFPFQIFWYIFINWSYLLVAKRAFPIKYSGICIFIILLASCHFREDSTV